MPKAHKPGLPCDSPQLPPTVHVLLSSPQTAVLLALSALTQLETLQLTPDLILSYDLMSGAVSHTTVSEV